MIEFLKNTHFSFQWNSDWQEIQDRSKISFGTQNRPYSIFDCVYFIREGVVRSYIVKNDQEITKWFYTKGDIIFSSRNLFYGKKTDIFLQASVPSVLVEISKDDYFFFRNKYTQFKELTKHLEDNFFAKYEEFENNRSVLDAHDLYSYFVNNYPYINLRVQIKHLASFLNVNPNTLSTIRKHYKETLAS